MLLLDPAPSKVALPCYVRPTVKKARAAPPVVQWCHAAAPCPWRVIKCFFLCGAKLEFPLPLSKVLQGLQDAHGAQQSPWWLLTKPRVPVRTVHEDVEEGPEFTINMILISFPS